MRSMGGQRRSVYMSGSRNAVRLFSNENKPAEYPLCMYAGVHPKELDLFRHGCFIPSLSQQVASAQHIMSLTTHHTAAMAGPVHVHDHLLSCFCCCACIRLSLLPPLPTSLSSLATRCPMRQAVTPHPSPESFRLRQQRWCQEKIARVVEHVKGTRAHGKRARRFRSCGNWATLFINLTRPRGKRLWR